jgi:hypothetical protein
MIRLRRLKFLRRWIKKYFWLYDLGDLVIGGNCGCCGKWIKDEIFEANENWGLCKECRERIKED